MPPNSRSVLAGYGDTGRPQWLELDVLLSRRGDSRVARLFERQDQLVALWMTPAELYQPLLPVFEDPLQRYRILGQLCVGWFFGCDANDPVAVTVELVQSGAAEQGGVLALNVIGVVPLRGAGGMIRPLHHGDLLELSELLSPLRRELEAAALQRRQRRAHARELFERQAERGTALLKDLARDLEHRSKVDGKRTYHARERARQGVRPTAKAFDEARSVARENLFEDRQKGTIVVLGAQGRVHVFSPQGKHVTSLVFPGNVVRARTQNKRWVPLSDAGCLDFQNRIRATGRS
jgi:hypothetical protein